VVTETILKIDKISIKNNGPLLSEAEVSEVLEDVTEKAETEPIASLLEQVETRSLAETMRSPIVGTLISSVKLPLSQTVSQRHPSPNLCI